MTELMRHAVAGASALEFWLSAVLIAALAVYLLRRGLDAFWRLRTIADIPTARIRSAPQGYVELAGHALAHRASVTAPLTELPCVCGTAI
jgi:hypothetical protein